MDVLRTLLQFGEADQRVASGLVPRVVDLEEDAAVALNDQGLVSNLRHRCEHPHIEETAILLPSPRSIKRAKGHFGVAAVAIG